MKANGEPPKATPKNEVKPICGIVMPISGVDGCPEAHWQEVREIIEEAIESVGFEPQMVSEADDTGIIQKRIIHNLYQNPIVVCDVSAKNPNVMFELGMRLAFDKPTIIVKDDKTSYSFDTSPIEHLGYPRDLRFSQIVSFKEDLAEKIQGTHQKATTDTNYTTFLKHFGTFTVPKLDTQEVSKDTFIIEELQSLRKAIGDFTNRTPVVPAAANHTLCLELCPENIVMEIVRAITDLPEIGKIEIQKPNNKHSHIVLRNASPDTKASVLELAKKMYPRAHFMVGRGRGRVSVPGVDLF